jgi:D-inositol-3-phosphate glycosyltransferase
MFHTLGAVKNAIGIGEEDPVLRIEAEKRLVESCQTIIAATDRGKQELERFYNATTGKINIVPCGVNMELFRPFEKNLAKAKLGLNNQKVVLFVGRLDPLKGVERLIEAMPEINAKLIIIGGDGSSRKELEKLEKISSSLGVKERIDFKGTVKQEELPYFYSAADVCAVPSYHESFSLVALEALSCGTPIVASDVGDLNSIVNVGKTGFVLENNNSVFLADALNRVLKWPERNMDSALQIRASINNYQWSDITVKIAGILNKVSNAWLVPSA